MPSKNLAMRKSTRTVLKTAKAQQVQLESEEEDPATAAVKVISAHNMEDIYVDQEEVALMRREEEEKSGKDGEEEEVEKDHRDKEAEQDDEEDKDEDDKPARQETSLGGVG